MCTEGVYTDQGDWCNAIHMGSCPACTAIMMILSTLEACQVLVCAEVSLTNEVFQKWHKGWHRLGCLELPSLVPCMMEVDVKITCTRAGLMLLAVAPAFCLGT